MMVSETEALPPRSAALLSKGNRIASCTSATIGQWSIAPSCTGSVAVTGGTETITVPSGNAGSIKITSTSADGGQQYQVNSGTWTAITANGNTIITVVNNDTLKFRETIGGSCAVVASTVAMSGTVYDNTTGAKLDDFSVSF